MTTRRLTVTPRRIRCSPASIPASGEAHAQFAAPAPTRPITLPDYRSRFALHVPMAISPSSLMSVPTVNVPPESRRPRG
jgi:hypothetical protein